MFFILWRKISSFYPGQSFFFFVANDVITNKQTNCCHSFQFSYLIKFIQDEDNDDGGHLVILYTICSVLHFHFVFNEKKFSHFSGQNFTEKQILNQDDWIIMVFYLIWELPLRFFVLFLIYINPTHTRSLLVFFEWKLKKFQVWWLYHIMSIFTLKLLNFRLKKIVVVSSNNSFNCTWEILFYFFQCQMF